MVVAADAAARGADVVVAEASALAATRAIVRARLHVLRPDVSRLKSSSSTATQCAGFDRGCAGEGLQSLWARRSRLNTTLAAVNFARAPHTSRSSSGVELSRSRLDLARARARTWEPMQHPLRSLTPSPDSSDAVAWDDVDEEIARLAREGREMDAQESEADPAARVERSAPPRTSLAGLHEDPDGGSQAGDVQSDDDMLAPRAEGQSDSRRRFVMLACACCLSIGRYVKQSRAQLCPRLFADLRDRLSPVTMRLMISDRSRRRSARARRASPAL